MKASSRSIFLFSFYVMGSGLLLLIFPYWVLELTSVNPEAQVITRMMGMVVFFLGIYYLILGKMEVTAFYKWTIPTRMSAIVFLTVFVLLQWLSAIVLVFGILDLAGAVWTALALAGEREKEKVK